MKTTLLRAGALSCALLASTALVTPAQAQSLPRFNQIDANGVDVYNGEFFFSMLEGSIGSGEGALSLMRNWAGNAGWTDNWSGILYQRTVGGTTQLVLQFGTYSDSFDVSGGTYTSTKADGATLTSLGSGVYRYVARDGTQIDYATLSPTGQALTAGSCTTLGGTLCGIPTAIRRPTGMTYTMAYDYVASTGYFRWRGVSNSANYGLTVDYATNTPGGGVPVANWYRRTQAQFTNLDTAPVSLPTATYNQVSGTVLDVTTTGGETWRLTTGTGGLVGIRRPGAGSDTTVINYLSGIVSGVVQDGIWASYSRVISGSGGSMTVTTADGDTIYNINLTRERITNWFDPEGRMTSVNTDSFGRLTGIGVSAAIVGGYSTVYTYDARGNVTEVRRANSAFGSPAPIILSSATYPSTCANPVTCNLPTSVTDQRGNTTDYTYDSTHGGILTATQPAPSGGADRPETRYSYTQVTAVTGEPVYMLTGVSACATGTVASSCVGTAAESRQVIAHDTDNLRTTSVTSRAGDNSVSATNAMTYDAIGNVQTVDGPLSGSSDTTRYRYDAARRVVGVTGPDPDGGGSLKHRAMRTTYTNGRPTSVEQGTVDSQSDGDWAAFTSLERIEQDYDAAARPSVQRVMSGSTTHQLTQQDYDDRGRLRCVAQRMNPSEFASLPSDACTLDTQGSDGPDRITRYTYNAVGETTKVETGLGVSGVAADEVTTTYTINGTPETVTDANGNRTTYVYDALGRLTRTRMPDPSTPGTSSATDYEELTYATATIGGNPASTNYVSTLRPRAGSGSTITFTYDDLGRPLKRDLNNVMAWDTDVTYAYDNLGRLTSATDSNAHSISFGYDALSRRLTETSNWYGAIATSQYDAAGRRTRLTWRDGMYVAYDYDLANQMTAIRENGATSGPGVLATYAYDDRGRRTSLTRGNGATTSYSYDTISRLTGLAHDLNGSGSDVTFGYSYNPAGEIASHTRSNDAYSYTAHANANVVTTVDGLNRLTAVGGVSVTHDTNGNVTAIGGGGSYAYAADNRLLTLPGTTFAYDPLGRLFGESAESLIFHHDGPQMIMETDQSTNTIQRRYVPGPGLDEPVAWYEGSGTSTRRWFHADERGSVVSVSDGSANLYGSNPNRYDEYGVPQGTLTGRFGFTGQAWMPQAGLYDYRARAYNPVLGRFMQTDPIGLEGGMNLYAYVGNNPVNFTDPMGLTQQEVIVTATRWRPQNASVGGSFGIGGSPLLGPQEPDFQSRLLGRLEPDCDSSNPENCNIDVLGQRRRRSPIMIIISQTLTTAAPFVRERRPARRRGDQCGGPGTQWVPDSLGGVDISGACARHDDCYGSSVSRATCDSRLHDDIAADCRQQQGGVLCRHAPIIYYGAVRMFGRPNYTGTGNPN